MIGERQRSKGVVVVEIGLIGIKSAGLDQAVARGKQCCESLVAKGWCERSQKQLKPITRFRTRLKLEIWSSKS